MNPLIGEHILKAFQKELETELWKVAEPIMRKKAEEIITSLAVRLVKEIRPDECQEYLKIVLGFPINKVDKKPCPHINCSFLSSTCSYKNDYNCYNEK